MLALAVPSSIATSNDLAATRFPHPNRTSPSWRAGKAWRTRIPFGLPVAAQLCRSLAEGSRYRRALAWCPLAQSLANRRATREPALLAWAPSPSVPCGSGHASNAPLGYDGDVEELPGTNMTGVAVRSRIGSDDPGTID